MKKNIILFIFMLINLLSYKVEAKKSEENIIVVTNNWTSQIVLSHVLKKILENENYKVQLKKLTVDKQWGEISRGWAHVQIEVWEGTMEKMFNRTVMSPGAEDIGTHLAVTREEWWYPEYVEKLCPGLPDWKALKKCPKVFSKGKELKGTYIGGPWEKPDKARIRALGLNFKISRVKEGKDLWTKLENAYSKNEPIILFNWTPNWVESKYKGSFVNFPDFDKRCVTDAKWGINTKWKYDCGNPKKGWLKKLAWSGIRKKWPCAHTIIKNFNLTNNLISDAAALVDSDKLSYESAAKEWIMKNEKVWKSWIPASCEN